MSPPPPSADEHADERTDERAAVRDPGAPAGAPGSRRRVVVVDDDPAVLRLVSAALAGEHDIEAYERPAEALEALRAAIGGSDDARGEGGEDGAGAVPDLIVSDIMMPGMTGFALHEMLRAVPALRSVPFVFLTALANRESMRRAMVGGADDYVTKPFTLAELRDAVRARLERADAQRAEARSELVATSLGGLGIVVGGRRVQWEARRAAELLLWLVDGGGSRAARDLRVDLFVEPPNDNAVRVLVNRLRKALGDDAGIDALGDELRLEYGGRVRWDARAFEQAATTALEAPSPPVVEAALALYAGEFLPGFDSPWSDAKRSRLEDLAAALLEAAVEVAETDAGRERARARLDAFWT